MDTDTLNHVLFRNPYTRDYFIGTFPACARATIRSRKNIYGFITNTENHDESGNHWCGWWIEDRCAIFFDSFGRPPTHHTLPNDFSKLSKRFKSCTYVDRPVQLPGSTTCGHFCADFIYQMSYGTSLKDFLSKYKHIANNDELVRTYFEAI
jgi:hypothetical protein